jgi:hypothetical protein
MRTLGSIIAIVFLGEVAFLFTTPAMAQSKWLESGRLDPSEVNTLCQRASDVRSLARAQMTTTGNERWLRLSRQKLVVEAFIMGTPPLDPGRCYVQARAGAAEETERRVFEVRDFVVNTESTTVFVIGRNFALPAESSEWSR